MPEAQDKTRRNYDRLSRFYDLLIGPFDRKYTEAGLRLLAPRPGERVLEVGYGTGEAVLALARAVGDAGQVRGIDISGKMREIALAKLEKAGLSGRAELIQGSALPLPCADNSFDAVYLSFTLELFTDEEIPVLLKECGRVLKPGGRLGVVAMSSVGGAALLLSIYGWLHRAFPFFFDCRPIDAAGLVRQAGLRIRQDRQMKMWSLPVAVVTAEKA